MDILKNLHKMISYQENTDREGFILQETKDDKKDGPDNGGKAADTDNSGKSADPDTGGKSPDIDRPRVQKRYFKKPRRPSEMQKGEPSLKQDSVSASLEQNREAINRLYGLPANKDIVVRDFYLGTNPSIKGMAVFIDGLTDKTVQDLLFSGPDALSRAAGAGRQGKTGGTCGGSAPSRQPGESNIRLKDVLSAINTGDTVLFLDGLRRSCAVETRAGSTAAWKGLLPADHRGTPGSLH
jgi:spore germination protein KA